MERLPHRRRLWSAAAAVLIILGTAAPGAAQTRITAEAFLASPAATAFKAKDYAGALEGFRALLETYPDDPLVLRYIGIALDRMGRYDEAVAAFGDALRVAPGDVSIRFFLGVSEYNRGGFAAAEASFSEVAAKAPDSKYGARAREFLTAIKAKATQQTAPPARKRWNAYLQLGLQHDDNAAAAPDGVADRDSMRDTEYLNLGYALVDGGQSRFRVEASGYLSHHWQDAFRSYDVQYLEAAATLDRAAALGEVSSVWTLRYGATRTYMESDDFMIGQRVDATVDLGWNDSLKTRLSYRAAVDDYEVDGFLPSVTSRDGLTHEAGVTQYILFDVSQREARLSLGYRYRLRDADGINNDSRSHTGSIGLSLPLPQEFTLDLGGRLMRDEYPRYTGLLGPRETDAYGASVALSRPIVRGLSASLSYAYDKEDSNYPTLDYDRGIATFALGYSF